MKLFMKLFNKRSVCMKVKQKGVGWEVEKSGGTFNVFL